jgi:hypothetical protein
MEHFKSTVIKCDTNHSMLKRMLGTQIYTDGIVLTDCVHQHEMSLEVTLHSSLSIVYIKLLQGVI